MAAPDPRFEFQFELGAPTAGNFNAAAGAPVVTLDASHWLCVVSGGTIPASTVVPGRFAVPWSSMHLAMLKVSQIDPAMFGTLATSRITSLRTLHDAFQRAVLAGLTFTVLGSFDLALAAFVRYAREHAQQNPASWVLSAASFQVLPAVPAAAPALPLEVQWLQALEYGMAINSAGQAVGVAAILAVLPGWCSHQSRALAVLQDCATVGSK